MNNELKKIKKVHFVGIKGVAMTSLAIYAKEAGFVVTGSDTEEDFPTTECLQKAKIKSIENFLPEHITQTKPDLVIYTGAHAGYQNPEVVTAVSQNITVLPHGKALGMFMEGKRQISVAGSHGKTTTSAMIATILSKAGLDPSYAVGCGEVFGLGLPGHFGSGEWFIAEADEYVTDPTSDPTPRFLWQNPEILVVTNIDFDHPDVFDSLQDVSAAFIKLRNKLPTHGSLILSSDDPNSKELIWADSSVTMVGEKDADCEVTSIHFNQGRTFFSLEYPGEWVGEFVLRVPGRHNAINAAMAIMAASETGVTRQQAYDSLYAFSGTKRRFENIGDCDGVLYFDDYAHHPKEIEATLGGARDWYKKRRIITIFQPHTYSRTKALLPEFATALSKSDVVILTDIYASAREHETMGITGKTLYTEVLKRNSRSYYAPTFREVKEALADNVRNGDIVVCMGAGDIYEWGRKIVEGIRNKE